MGNAEWGMKKGADLRERTQRFALEVMRFIDVLPRDRKADVVGKQLLRSATSVGANYRSACRAKSKADFIAKLAIVEEEADECLYWFELIVESGLVGSARTETLRKEANEIVSVIVASIKTARNGHRIPVLAADRNSKPVVAVA